MTPGTIGPGAGRGQGPGGSGPLRACTHGATCGRPFFTYTPVAPFLNTIRLSACSNKTGIPQQCSETPEGWGPRLWEPACPILPPLV